MRSHYRCFCMERCRLCCHLRLEGWCSVHFMRTLGDMGRLRRLGTLGQFAILIIRQCFAIRTVTTIAVATATTATATWCFFAVLGGATFDLRRKQLRLNGIRVQTIDRCR